RNAEAQEEGEHVWGNRSRTRYGVLDLQQAQPLTQWPVERPVAESVQCLRPGSELTAVAHAILGDLHTPPRSNTMNCALQPARVRHLDRDPSLNLLPDARHREQNGWLHLCEVSGDGI